MTWQLQSSVCLGTAFSNLSFVMHLFRSECLVHRQAIEKYRKNLKREDLLASLLRRSQCLADPVRAKCLLELGCGFFWWAPWQPASRPYHLERCQSRRGENSRLISQSTNEAKRELLLGCGLWSFCFLNRGTRSQSVISQNDIKLGGAIPTCRLPLVR